MNTYIYLNVLADIAIKEEINYKTVIDLTEDNQTIEIKNLDLSIIIDRIKKLLKFNELIYEYTFHKDFWIVTNTIIKSEYKIILSYDTDVETRHCVIKIINSIYGNDKDIFYNKIKGLFR